MVSDRRVIIFVLLKMNMDQRFTESLTKYAIQSIVSIYISLIMFLMNQQNTLKQPKLNWHQNTLLNHYLFELPTIVPN